MYKKTRHGMALVWAIIAFTTLMMLTSLAVDYGRVQVAKTELQNAADAAARAGATGLLTSAAQARSNAIAVAALNYADATSVSLANSDIDVGNWSGSTFTVNGTPNNAIRVRASRTSSGGNAIPLFFTRMLGLTGCDVHATAVATVAAASGSSYGVVGLSGVTLSGATWIDSYNSGSGSYSYGSHLSNGDTATNGTIAMSGSAKIYGDGSYGGGYTHSGTAAVTGVASALSSSLSYANPTLPGSYTNMGTYSSLGYGTATLTAGNYYYNSFTLNGSCVMTAVGTVNIYVNGNINISNNTALVTSTPSNLHIYMMGSSTLTLGGSGTLTGVVYAPSGTLDISGASYLLGSAIVNFATLSGSGAIHVDEAITGSGTSSSGSGTVTTVN